MKHLQSSSFLAIYFLHCCLVEAQNKNENWHLSGKIADKNIYAYFVKDIKSNCPNVLVYKTDTSWDTLMLCTYPSKLPYFEDSCRLKSIQLDGQGREELLISWDYKIISDKGQKAYTIYTIWDLDIKQKIFHMTPQYFRLSSNYNYFINEAGKIVDSILVKDSCVYQNTFAINDKDQIVIEKLSQSGKCLDNNCWKREEGIYVYERKKIIKTKNH